MRPSTPIFHIHPVTGEPSRCRAMLHRCPFSAYEQHFETADEARVFFEQYADRLSDPTQSAKFHFVTAEEEDDFTVGDCGILARELYRKTGWPLVLASSKSAEKIEDIDWDHMAVRAPDGRIVDAVGMSTEEDFLGRWPAAQVLTEVSGEDWSSVHIFKQQFKSSPVKVANKILKSLESLGVWSK